MRRVFFRTNFDAILLFIISFIITFFFLYWFINAIIFSIANTIYAGIFLSLFFLGPIIFYGQNIIYLLISNISLERDCISIVRDARFLYHMSHYSNKVLYSDIKSVSIVTSLKKSDQKSAIQQHGLHTKRFIYLRVVAEKKGAQYFSLSYMSKKTIRKMLIYLDSCLKNINKNIINVDSLVESFSNCQKEYYWWMRVKGE